MYITEIEKDGDLRSAANNFIQTVDANQTVLGMTAAKVSALNLLVVNFGNGIDSANAARDAAKTATEDKNDARSALKSSISSYAKIWRGNSAVPDSLLTNLQLPAHNTPPTTVNPQIPTDLSYSVNASNVVTLKWKANGNKFGVIYIIETAEGLAGPWTIFELTGQRKFEFIATPGETMCFRIIARRNGKSSAPSTPITLWGGGSGETTLSIAA